MIDVYKLENYRPMFKKRKYKLENIYHKYIFRIIGYSALLWVIGKVLNEFRIAI